MPLRAKTSTMPAPMVPSPITPTRAKLRAMPGVCQRVRTAWGRRREGHRLSRHATQSSTRRWQDHRVLTGLLGAFAAAVLYGAATVLQAAGVRSLRRVPTGASWPARLWAGRLYAVGLGLDGLGFLASIAALRTLPLFVVQSAIASSVAVTALLAVLFLDARLERLEVLALAVGGLGLLALALGATDEPAVPLGSGARWVVLAGVVPVAGVALAGVIRRGPRSAVLLAVASGLGFGGVGVASRVLV